MAELARLLQESEMVDLAEKVDRALTFETKALALTIVDREFMLRTLDAPSTDALSELRGVLVRPRCACARRREPARRLVCRSRTA